MKFPGVVAVHCVVPSGLVLHIGITSCTFPPWTEMSKKNVCMPHVQSPMHVLCVAYVRSVQMFFLIKCANLSQGAKNME